MNRSRLLMLVAWIVVAVLWNSFQDQDVTQEAQRRPAPLPQSEGTPRGDRSGPTLPAPARGDPTTAVDLAPCEEACTGTAFAIDREGHWLTAQHVINGCVEVGLQTGRNRFEAVRRIEEHPRADLAALWTDRRAPELALAGPELSRDQVSYAFGFPKGEPGAVQSTLLGRIRLKVSGSRRFVSPAIAWAEVERVPDSLPALGGLSGGPLLDESGAVIGVAVAASKRRGRVISATPASIEELVGQVGWDPARATSADLSRTRITPGSFADYGDTLRGNLAVARVICIGEKQSRRRRPKIL